MVKKERQEELQKRMKKLGIQENVLVEKFILGSGSGGQKINKTSSCVYLKHIPTGIEVKCQQDRSREINRYLARRELCKQIETQIHKIKTEKQYQIEKLRRQKRRRSRRSKDKMLKEKKYHAEKKGMRQAPREFE